MLSTLIIYNHAQNEENRDARIDYYLTCRVEIILSNKRKAEEEENKEFILSILITLYTNYISENEEFDKDEDLDESIDDDF
jgi:hypothetical protein